MKKQIGYIGLDKMGKGMALRLLEHGWDLVAYNRDQEKVKPIVSAGAIGASSIEDLVAKLPAPRTIFLMIAHSAVDEVLSKLTPLLESGDVVIDGGNSLYIETKRRAVSLLDKGISFLDIGVSGGPDGARNGACMMIGGERSVYDTLSSVGFFTDICSPEAYAYMGTYGAGHFVKMVHNGIEYGMMQAIAEGFDLLHHTKEFDFDLVEVTRIYGNKSVIDSRLISWMYDAYKKYGPDLNDISGRASASGEGKWTCEAGAREGIAMPVIQDSLDVRIASQEQPSYQGTVVSAMRGEFGKHPVKRGEDEKEVL